MELSLREKQEKWEEENLIPFAKKSSQAKRWKTDVDCQFFKI